MKHQHSADVNIKIDIPAKDLENLIDKTTEAVLTIITAATVAHILKKIVLGADRHV